MYVTAKVLGMECGVSERTIQAHANRMERDGIRVKARMGRPQLYCREVFLRTMFPGWKEDEKVREVEG